MGQRDNLGRFVRGQSGNPEGRPKKSQSLSDILQKHAGKRDVKDGDTVISRKEAIAKKLWALALAGDLAAIKYIYDRIDGRPVQPTELSGPGGDAIPTAVAVEFIDPEGDDGGEDTPGPESY